MLSFGPTFTRYIHENWTMAEEKKCGAIENILGNTLQIWGTCLEPDGKILGTWWEHIGNKKNPLPPPPPKNPKKETKPP